MSSEASPQTDKACCWVPSAVETDAGRYSAPRREAAFMVAQGVSGRIEACGSSSTGARTMNVARNATETLAAHATLRRQDVPQHLRAGVADGRGGGALLPQGARRSGAVGGADGADDARVRAGTRAVRGEGTGGPGAVRAARAQGRPDAGVPAGVLRHRGLLYIGKAQEKARVLRTERRSHPVFGPYPWLVSSTAMVHLYYVYAVDDASGRCS